VAALEPGFAPSFQRDPATFWRHVRSHLVGPTAEIGGPGAATPPALVLWPETTWPARLAGEPPRLEPPIPIAWLAPGTRLCAGTVWSGPEGERAVAVLLDHRGQLLGWHEKLRPVPAGERLPLLDVLPDGLVEGLVRWGSGLVGFVPDLLPGRPKPPLRTAGGTPFAALLCFDNAFDDVVREHVAAGARFLAVLSNESWYRGGAELEQMVAMSVFRALETATPLIRSTVDGATSAVGADGRILGRLSGRASAGGPARILALELPLGPGALPPMARFAPALVFVVLASAAFLFWHLVRSWDRLPAVRSGSGGDAACDTGSGDPPQGGP
jgi:apolipoprotein N-acyltransferase